MHKIVVVILLFYSGFVLAQNTEDQFGSCLKRWDTTEPKLLKFFEASREAVSLSQLDDYPKSFPPTAKLVHAFCSINYVSTFRPIETIRAHVPGNKYEIQPSRFIWISDQAELINGAQAIAVVPVFRSGSVKVTYNLEYFESNVADLSANYPEESQDWQQKLKAYGINAEHLSIKASSTALVTMLLASISDENAKLQDIYWWSLKKAADELPK